MFSIHVLLTACTSLTVSRITLLVQYVTGPVAVGSAQQPCTSTGHTQLGEGNMSSLWLSTMAGLQILATCRECQEASHLYLKSIFKGGSNYRMGRSQANDRHKHRKLPAVVILQAQAASNLQ